VEVVVPLVVIEYVTVGEVVEEADVLGVTVEEGVAWLLELM